MNASAPVATQGFIPALMHSTALTRSTLMASLVASTLFLAPPARAVDDLALPSGGTVVGGSATLNFHAPGQLGVNQSSDRLVVDWNSFNIGSKATTTFAQPNAGSLAVNRVTGAGNDPTQILGNLKSNGRIMVLDRNGVVFGKGARVDVGGIVASTGDIATSDVMSGGNQLKLKDFGDAAVENRGDISVADGGLAALVAPTVRNSGTITARLGRVALAAGDKVTVDLYGDKLIEMELDSKASKAIIEQTGAINAEGGLVQISARAARGVVDNVINMDGVINAASVSEAGGRIILSGGTVNVGGQIDASGATGGNISVEARQINLKAGSAIAANSVKSRAAGAIKVVADQKLTVAGKLSATGQTGAGNIETSGKTLDFADGASVQTTGEWLIDPTDITIDTALDVMIESQLAFGNVTVTTASGGGDAGNIFLETEINWSSDNQLTLNADNDILFTTAQAALNATGSAAFALLTAGRNISLANGNGIVVNGGDISLASQRFRLDSGVVNANGGNVSISTTGGFQANANSIGTTGTATVTVNQNKDADPFLSNNTIQNAINAIQNTGGGTNTISVGAGVYNEDVVVDRAVTLNGANSGIAGYGTRGAESIISPTGTGFTVTDRDAVIDGFTINSGVQAVLLNSGDRSSVINNIIGASTGNAIAGDGATNAVIANNLILDSGGAGVALANGSDNALISGNAIGRTDDHAISLVFSDASQVLDNYLGYSDAGLTSAGVQNINGNGIYVFAAGNAGGGRTIIKGNRITDTSSPGAPFGSGIGVYFGNHVDVGGAGLDANILSNLAWDGISFYQGTDVNVTGNQISNAARSGVFIANIAGAAITGNSIDGADDFFGVDVVDSSDVSVSANAINDTNLSGINLTDLTGATTVSGNTVDNAGWHGIRTVRVSNMAITDNDIGQNGAVTGDGILVMNSDNAGNTRTTIIGNNIANTSFLAPDYGSGIDVRDSRHVDIGGASALANTIVNMGRDGIRAERGDDINITGNRIDDVERSGVYVTDVDDVNISGNDIDGTSLTFGIDTNASNNVSIDGNLIANTAAAGINLTNLTGPASVSGNTIANAGTDGIASFGTAIVDIGDNTVTNVANSGVRIRGPFYGQISVHDNSVTNANVGMTFESGLIDLTGAGNTLNNGMVGYRFAPIVSGGGFTAVNLVGDTIGTTTFTGQTSYYVELLNGALFAPGAPTFENGLDSTYDGINPAANGGFVTDAELATLESKFYHFVDDATLGLFFFGTAPAVTTAALDQSDIFNDNLELFTPGLGNAGFTITGLPRLPGSIFTSTTAITNPADLNSLAPAAGGEAPQAAAIDPSAEELAALEPAAGGGQGTPCWSDAVNLASEGQVASYSFSTDAFSALRDANACGTANN